MFSFASSRPSFLVGLSLSQWMTRRRHWFSQAAKDHFVGELLPAFVSCCHNIPALTATRFGISFRSFVSFVMRISWMLARSSKAVNDCRKAQTEGLEPSVVNLSKLCLRAGWLLVRWLLVLGFAGSRWIGHQHLQRFGGFRSLILL